VEGDFRLHEDALIWQRPPIRIESERLVLRVVDEADIADLLSINQDDEVTRYLPYESWRSVEDGMAWLERMRKIDASGTGTQLVVFEKASGRAIGTCLLFRHEEGKGFMHEALSALISHAFDACALRRLEAEVNTLNVASCRLVERLGFANEGLLRKRWFAKGAAYDTKFYGLLREEWSAARP
jgi:[ribosomal protein S5]-alanine N-acetyltransferase